MKARQKASITYLIWNTKLYGGNKVVLTHVKNLQKHGHNAKVISIFPGKASWFSPPMKIHSVISCFFNPPADILVASLWITSYIAAFLPAKQKYYFVQNWEMDFYHSKLLTFLVRMSFRLPLRIITISKYLKKRITVLKPKKPIFIVPNALEPVYHHKPLRKRIKKNGKSSIRILSVCTTYSQYKGVDILEKVVKELKRTHVNKYFFILVSTEKKPYSPIFDTFVNNPSTQRLLKIYRESDILLHTSRTEGFPLPPLEAMACGCIVITTDSGGIKEYAKHNFNAILVKNVDDIWNNDIIQKLLLNSTLRIELIKNGLETVKLFSWKHITEKLIKIYFQDQL